VSLTTGLISYWRLEESSGTRFDAHGSDNLVSNNSVSSVSGKIGNAATFSHSKYLGPTTVTNFATSEFSVAFWMKPRGQFDPHLYTCQAGEAVNDRFQVGGFTATFVFRNGSLSFAITDDTWQHVVLTANLPGEGKAYLNGELMDTKSSSLGPLASASTIKLGMYLDGGTPDGAVQRYYRGEIDEFARWSRILTSDEVIDLYNNGDGRDYEYVASGGGGGDVDPINRIGAQRRSFSLGPGAQRWLI